MPSYEALKSLHASLIDATKGYDEAINDAEVGEMKALFTEMRALHQRAHGEVHAILLSKGQQPNESGSFMALVHQTVISVRSALTGLDRSSLESFASGEDHIVNAYDKAIEENLQDAAVFDKLTQQRTQLTTMIAKLRAQKA
jgi:uncharacterized protein (TIGR02284 family)